MGYKIVLTSDRATMTDYSGCEPLGFLLCLPYRLVPWLILEKILAPPIDVDEELRAKVAPYPLRKLEASLLREGFSRKDVIVTTPEMLETVIDDETRIVGIHVLDPLGMAPVSHTLSALAGGGLSCTALLFNEFMNKLQSLKHSYGFTIIAGGPGTWQIKGVFKKYGIDVLFCGEGEVLFPKLCRDILEGRKIPKIVSSAPVPVCKIPPIVAPSRNGLVEITRGCPRGCSFCSPTVVRFRSIPLSNVLREVEINVKAGFKYIDLVTDDGFLYGAKGINVNEKALEKLLFKIASFGVSFGFCHVGIATILQAPRIVSLMTELAGFSINRPYFPQVGLETGSPRIIATYMAGKPSPWSPDKWPELAIEATKLMNENYWYPCYTLIVGFPDETSEDIVKTLELVDVLRNMKAKCWLFPLLLTPIGRTRVEKLPFGSLAGFTDEHWDLLLTCIEHDIFFTREVLHALISRIQNPLKRIIAQRFIETGLHFLQTYKGLLRSYPEVLIDKARQLNIYLKNPLTLIHDTIVSYLKGHSVRSSLQASIASQ